MQRPHPAQTCGVRRGRAPAHRLGPGKIADYFSDRLGQHLGGGAAGLVDHREPRPVAVLQLVLCQPGLAQETVERLRRRGRLGALQFLAHCLGRGGQSPGDQRQPARGRVCRDPVMRQPRRGQRLAHHPRQVTSRLGLHPSGNFLRQQFEEKVGAGAHAAYPLCVIHAAQAPLARSRTRPIYAWRSATEITPRACSVLKMWLALIACS